MNHIKTLIAILTFSTISFAQKNKSQPVLTQPTYSSAKSALGFNFGLIKSAINLGVTYDSAKETGAFGGYFFLQTDKKDNQTVVVKNTMSFGGHVLLNLYSQNEWALGLRPGAGITIIKDVVNSTGSKSDATLITPTIRWSVTHKLTNNNDIGLELLQYWNLHNSEIGTPASDEVLSFVFRMPI